MFYTHVRAAYITFLYIYILHISSPIFQLHSFLNDETISYQTALVEAIADGDPSALAKVGHPDLHVDLNIWTTERER